MRMRRLAAIAAALGMASALTACGSTSPAYTPLTLVDFGTTVSHSVSGLRTVHIDLASDLMTIHEDFRYGPPFALTMTGQIRYQGHEATYRERLIGSILYVQAVGETPTGKFLRIDASKLPATAGIFKVLHQIQSAGPRAFAAQLKRTAIKSLNYDGMSLVDGQLARHYTLVVDARAATRVMGGDAAAQAYATRLNEITEEVYLTSQHRPLRITMALPAPVGRMTIDFSRYGEPVTVTAPPPADVIDVPTSALVGAPTSS